MSIVLATESDHLLARPSQFNCSFKGYILPALTILSSAPAYYETVSLFLQQNQDFSDFVSMLCFEEYALTLTLVPMAMVGYKLKYGSYDDIKELFNEIKLIDRNHKCNIASIIIVISLGILASVPAYQHAIRRFEQNDINVTAVDPLLGTMFLIYGLTFSMLPLAALAWNKNKERLSCCFQKAPVHIRI